MKHVGEIIKLRRKELGYTLQQVIDRMDFDYDTGNLSRLERGLQKHSEELLLALATALDTSISEIYAEAEGRPHLDKDAQRIINKFAEASVEGSLTQEGLQLLESMISQLSKQTSANKEVKDGAETTKTR
jgi:transcriptional regulator with XRE-family HTH domain